MEHRIVAAANLAEKSLDSEIVNSIKEAVVAIAESSSIIFKNFKAF